MATDSEPLASTRVLLAGTESWLGEFETALETRTGATVHSASTAEAAVDAVRNEGLDCVVTAHELEASTGIALLRSIRESSETIPVLFCTSSGDESVASEAVDADVSGYVPISTLDDAEIESIIERIEESVGTRRRKAQQHDRARQFDAIFQDPRTATWVLDPEGALRRANETGGEMIDGDVESVLGEEFWRLPSWSGDEGVQADVRRIVETAIAGRFGNAVVTRTFDPDVEVVDLSARPVHDDRGQLRSIVVEAVDISERVALERDLRRSEELHRVTLNNMTDTVLITDENGEYTYVCPNVNFIFGYTAAEIRELGSIEALLGEDLFDRAELAEEGVLKNIEVTATDKAGHEHTLLVNVREVSIQDGTLLYSCRDVTKRKQREVALATLQETAREFLYAETRREIAQQVVDDTAGVLDLDASAVYLFDVEANELQPAAGSPAMERLDGPLPVARANGEGLVSHSFVENEAMFFDDVHESPQLQDRATGLRSTAYIPLGNHGVFVAGSPSVGEFDDVLRELADLLAATAEAALDRVTRESQLRSQDRELQRQNNQLTRLNRINETIREIDQAVVQAETREEIDHTVCELLTVDDRFTFAWIGEESPATGTVEPRAWAGAEQGYLDSVTFTVDTTAVEPAGRTVATREITNVANVAGRLREEDWRTDALSRDFLSVISIPLEYNDLSYGVLNVYADTQAAFDETVRAVLRELGETIASATSAIERKNALVTRSVTRIEFEIDDPSFVLSKIAREADCELSYQGGIQQTADGSYVVVTVDGAAIDQVEHVAESLIAVDEVRQISGDESGGVLGLRLAQAFLATELADHGAVFRSASATPDSTTLVVEVPESVTPRHISQLIHELFTGVEIRSKQDIDRSSREPVRSRVFDELTDRQLEVTQTAYYSGFFESPREHTGAEVAEMLGISPPAFSTHIRTVERKLFSALFEEA
ncbi:bacterio-opsin activator domain-containing protein [Natranaeroarchaeum aerophilus]|uniref:GAF domain-containing protein n=1 Tax=Natranaeroarchaeum aerophilus TaxID=2917711 RepID=A0AAE3FRC5_9EURY|nr:bacterio-opsin activator domain-containing protein [Natranaeroarchaeum aerophilus]MCL9813741.1 GAF domain-containing protein [Natranaeroarchaeum aerophilus]